MHEQLATLRSMHIGYVERLQRTAQKAERRQQDHAVSDRRDWPFPLYPAEMIDELARAVVDAVGAQPVAWPHE